MKKRLIVITLLIMVIGSFLWAEGKQEVGGTVYLRMYYPVGVAGPLAKLMNDIVNDFNKSQNEVYVESIFAGGYREAMEKAQTAYLAGKPPEFAVLDGPTLLTLRDVDAIIPLDDFIAKEGGKKFTDQFISGFMIITKSEGKIWSIPWQRSTPILYYNKDFFNEAGLVKPPETWTELANYSEKLKKVNSSGKITRWGLEFPIDFWLLKPLILQAGGKTENEAGTKVFLDTPEAKKTFRFLLDLAYNKKVMPPVKQWGESVNDFVAGTTSMLYNSTGALTYIRKSSKYKVGAGFLPGDVRKACIEGGGNFFIFKTDKRRQEAAWKVIKWMTKPENTARWSLGSGYIPVKYASFKLPNYKKYTDEVPEALVAYRQLTEVHMERNFMTHRVNEIVNLVDNTIEEVLGGADLNSTLKKVQAKADKILSKWQ